MSDVKTAILLCCHGSRDPQAITSTNQLVAKLRNRVKPQHLLHGYLEFASPSLPEQLNLLARQGYSTIIGVPLMLGAAGHVKNDIAWLLRDFGKNSGIATKMTSHLGLDIRMINLASERIAQVIKQHRLVTSETSLLVIGRGTSDPDANGDIAKLTRLLQEGFNFPFAGIGYSGVAQPDTRLALRQLAALPYRNIIVLPYLLFTGVLVKRIETYCQQLSVMPQFNDKQILPTSHLGVDDRVIDCLLDRLQEVDNPDLNVMNCRLCKYRTVMPGHASAHGQGQAAHHFHHQAPPHSH